MKDDVSLMAHLNHMESLLTQLAALQAPVGEDDQVAVLLSSIYDIQKYKEIIPALQVASMDFHDKVAMLFDHDHRHTATPFGQEALFIKGKGKFQPFKYNHCGKLGHTEDRCF